MTDKAPLAPKRSGYLRCVPSATAEPRAIAGPFRGMANKLVLTGHVEVDEKGLYRRTVAGDEALEAFDANLSDAAIAVLEAVRDRKPGIASMRGVAMLLDADLIRCSERSQAYSLNDHGVRILEDRDLAQAPLLR